MWEEIVFWWCNVDISDAAFFLDNAGPHPNGKWCGGVRSTTHPCVTAHIVSLIYSHTFTITATLKADPSQLEIMLRLSMGWCQ